MILEPIFFLCILNLEDAQASVEAQRSASGYLV